MLVCMYLNALFYAESEYDKENLKSVQLKQIQSVVYIQHLQVSFFFKHVMSDNKKNCIRKQNLTYPQQIYPL